MSTMTNDVLRTANNVFLPGFEFCRWSSKGRFVTMAVPGSVVPSFQIRYRGRGTK